MNTEAALEELRGQLARSPAVQSAALYGSYVRGDHDARQSDVNLALVVRAPALESLAAPLQAAWRAARIDPWIAKLDELRGLVDVFATRVRDIQRHHTMLCGDDPWVELVVPPAALRLRIEQELRNQQMRLRHAQVLGDASTRARQLATAAGALRHDLALIEELAGAEVPDGLDATAAALAARLGLPAADVRAVLGYGRDPASPPPLDAATRLLDRAVHFVDGMEVR